MRFIEVTAEFETKTEEYEEDVYELKTCFIRLDKIEGIVDQPKDDDAERGERCRVYTLDGGYWTITGTAD